MNESNANVGPDMNVMRSGDNIISISLSRRGVTTLDPEIREQVGAIISIRTHPVIEQFFQTAGAGEPSPVDQYGKEWLSVDGVPLIVYQMKQINVLRGMTFRFDCPGREISLDGFTNLSLLRLKGISSERGVTFGLHGVFRLSQLQEMKDALLFATNDFYTNFLKPVDLRFALVVK